MSKPNLDTGGTRYIASRTPLARLQFEDNVITLDNLSTKSAAARESELADRLVIFVQGEIREQALSRGQLSNDSISAVTQFPGVEPVQASVQDLAKCIDNYRASAVTSQYWRSMWTSRCILRELAHLDPCWRNAVLRYYNPVVAKLSGRRGEDPAGILDNNMPCIARKAVGHVNELLEFGDEHTTHNGTEVKDLIDEATRPKDTSRHRRPLLSVQHGVSLLNNWCHGLHSN